jgi:hypothetical protein
MLTNSIKAAQSLISNSLPKSKISERLPIGPNILGSPRSLALKRNVIEHDYNQESQIKTAIIQDLNQQLIQLDHDIVSNAMADGFIKSNKRRLFFKEECIGIENHREHKFPY